VGIYIQRAGSLADGLATRGDSANRDSHSQDNALAPAMIDGRDLHLEGRGNAIVSPIMNANKRIRGMSGNVNVPSRSSAARPPRLTAGPGRSPLTPEGRGTLPESHAGNGPRSSTGLSRLAKGQTSARASWRSTGLRRWRSSTEGSAIRRMQNHIKTKDFDSLNWI